MLHLVVLRDSKEERQPFVCVQLNAHAQNKVDVSGSKTNGGHFVCVQSIMKTGNAGPIIDQIERAVKNSASATHNAHALNKSGRV